MTPDDEAEVAASTERLRLVVDRISSQTQDVRRTFFQAPRQNGKRFAAEEAGFTFAPDFADRSELLGSQEVAPRRARRDEDGR